MEELPNNVIINCEDDNSSYEDSKKPENNNNQININIEKNIKKIESNSSDSDLDLSSENINNEKEEEKIDDEGEKSDEKDDYEDRIKYIENNPTPRTIEKGLIESINKRENVTKENLALAEKINFKNNPNQILETDEFGFIKNKENNESVIKHSLSTEDILTINARTEKWKYMINNYEYYKKRRISKLKKRTRKGIPDSLRSYVWQLFANIQQYTQKNLFENLEKEKLDYETEITIIKDLDRTFPACLLFSDKYGIGQRKLFKVLTNYSKFNKKIGYVQGMGYLVALFLIYMDEESSFYLLHSIIKNYGLEGIYSPGFPDLKKKFYVLLNLEKKFIPRVYEILKRDTIYPSIYASEWFICLFSKDLQPNALVRVMDTFLFEGYKVIYRFALAFLKIKEEELIKSKPGIVYTMDILKKCFDNINIDVLFKVAFSFRLSKKHISKFEQEYEQNKNNSNNEFIKQIV